MDFDLEVAQGLLDIGMSGRAVGRELGLHHSAIFRAIESGQLDGGYVPFDDNEDRSHLYQNFEWLWEEDKLEEILTELYEGRRVILNDFLGEDYRSVGTYVRKEYGDIFEYFRIKKFSRMVSGVKKTCSVCNRNVILKKYSKSSTTAFGVESSCKECSYKRVRHYILTSESYRESLKIYAHNRRAKERLLPYGFTER